MNGHLFLMARIFMIEDPTLPWSEQPLNDTTFIGYQPPFCVHCHRVFFHDGVASAPLPPCDGRKDLQ